MSYNKEDIDKTFKEIVNEPDFMYDYAGTFLKDKPISYINDFMEDSGLSYFEVFIESELADIRQEVEADNLRLVRVRAGSKRAIDNDYYHKRLSQKEILSHNGNFGVCIGYNHLKGKSLACVDIDGVKLKKLNKKERQQLPSDQLELLDNMTEERKEEIEKESKDYLLTCVLAALPSAMVVETQSGGYHVFINNQTHIEDSSIVDEADKDTVKQFHYVSNHLRLPQTCPIEEIRGLPLFNALEIFTKFESKYCVLAGSFIKNNKAGTTNSYKLREFPESVKTFGELGTVADINKNIKDHLIEYGFTWEDRLRRYEKQISCFLTFTDERSIAAVKRHMSESPLVLANITNEGPKHCPSIDRKLLKFPDMVRHQIFVEPEGWKSQERKRGQLPPKRSQDWIKKNL